MLGMRVKALDCLNKESGERPAEDNIWKISIFSPITECPDLPRVVFGRTLPGFLLFQVLYIYFDIHWGIYKNKKGCILFPCLNPCTFMIPNLKWIDHVMSGHAL